ncbi:hypothetical protein BHE74_00045987 [Ensete ventricosum]|nr:hypothetical protein GW17_00038228 [Ensete ventricosum]RWW47986.1 hypothetical protein BHE74_00045987 [Ensete ventricosum]RZR93305.1 hypothetical protein BHM03_00021771 [Ensete ventricosum]
MARYPTIPPKSTIGERFRPSTVDSGKKSEEEEEEEKKKEEEEGKKKEVPRAVLDRGSEHLPARGERGDIIFCL